MRLTPRPSLLCLPLLLLCLPATGQEQPTPATAPAEAEYVPLEQLRSFYKLMPQASQKGSAGTRTVGNAGTTITFGPGRKELSIGGYRWLLSHPVKEDGAGDLLISRVDMVKLIDPILRPTYIAERRLVRTVVIDPGHGGYDTGVVSDYVREEDFALQLAAELKERLSRRGYQVVLTHAQNRHLSDQQRIAAANEADAPIFLSLHLNSGRSDIHGIETYTAAPAAPGEPLRPANKHDAANAALAFALHSSMVARTGARDGACRRAQYSLLNSIDCPSAMILAGYATNREEGSRLATAEYRSRLAEAITEGVSSFALAINPDATLEPAPEAEPEPPEPVKAEQPKPAQTKNKASAKPAKRKPQKNTRRNRNKRRK